MAFDIFTIKAPPIKASIGPTTDHNLLKTSDNVLLKSAKAGPKVSVKSGIKVLITSLIAPPIASKASLTALLNLLNVPPASLCCAAIVAKDVPNILFAAASFSVGSKLLFSVSASWGYFLLSASIAAAPSGSASPLENAFATASPFTVPSVNVSMPADNLVKPSACAPVTPPN